MSFSNAEVLSFESRRAREMGELIRINGGKPFIAPAVVEVPLEHNEAAFEFAARLYAGGFDMMIFLTGAGARLLDRVLASKNGEERFRNALRKIAIVARGPKPSAVLREWNVPIAVQVPEPNTWRELLAAVAGRSEKSVAVQEYGRPNLQLMKGLERQGRTVTAVRVYQWRLPDNVEPLDQALSGLLEGRFSAALFTTGVQMENFLEFADAQQQREAAIAALQRIFVGSIGPVCSEVMRECGVPPAFEPSHPRMGILVREAAEKFADRKRTE